MKPIPLENPDLNDLEIDSGQYLANLKRAGKILDFRYEPFCLRIGHGSW